MRYRLDPLSPTGLSPEPEPQPQQIVRQPSGYIGKQDLSSYATNSNLQTINDNSLAFAVALG